MDRALIEEIQTRELKKLELRTPRSFELIRRSVEPMPLGVPSSIFSMAPYPITILSGQGAPIIDADGHQYSDYGNGYGTTVFGHAHPEITAAITARAQRGSFFGALGEEVTIWAELLTERFNLDWVRFSNSGSEAVMDALRLGMSLTGRTGLAKIEGAYDGTSPWAMWSVHPGEEQIDRSQGGQLTPVALGGGLESINNVAVLPFNDLQAAAELLRREQTAVLVLEPILFNSGAIFPQDGYLAGLRELCTKTGTLLMFDEVKTGVAIAYGGAEEYFGVQPDLKSFGKGIGGGLSCGAFGGADDRGYEEIKDYRAPHFGTFSGNHLAAAAGAAALRLLDDQAYQALNEHRSYLAAGLNRVIDSYQLPAYVVGAGAKNCVVWAPPPELVDFRDYLTRLDEPLGSALWFWMMNRGVWLTPGRDEQTTHSIAHQRQDADRYIAAFESFAAAISA
jgi:glutamate-1-semialdehyde 2,1-aminomutase